MKVISTCIFCLLSIVLLGQDEIDFNLIVNNKITTIEGYDVSLKDSSIQALKTLEIFNKRGRRTSIKIFKENGKVSEYEYQYRSDTLIVARLARFDGRLHSKTLITYDRKGRQVESRDVDALEKPMGTYSKTKYKKRGKVKEHKIYIRNKLYSHTKEIQDQNEKAISYYIKENKKWSKIAKPEFKKETIMNFGGTSLTLQRTIRIIKKEQTILGIIAPVDLKEKDELITEEYLNNKGLVEEEIQYLNSKIIARKKYKYKS